MTSPSLPDPVEPSAAPVGATTAPSAAIGKPKRRVTVKDIVAIVALALIVTFVVENYGRTKIRFIVPQVTTYLWLALLIATAFGFVLGFLFGLRRDRRAMTR